MSDNQDIILTNLVALALCSGLEILLPQKLPDPWIQILQDLNEQQGSNEAISILTFVVLLLLNHQASGKRINEIRAANALPEGDVFEIFHLDASVNKMPMVFSAIDIYMTHLKLETLRRSRVIKDLAELTLGNLFQPEKGAIVTFFDPLTDRQELTECLDDSTEPFNPGSVLVH